MRYYCHHCHTQISADELLPDFTCPSCQSGFVEEIPVQSSSSRRNSSADEAHRSGLDDSVAGFISNRMSSDEYSDDNSDVEFLDAVNGPIAHVLGLLQHQTPQLTQATPTTTIGSPASGQSQQQRDSETSNTTTTTSTTASQQQQQHPQRIRTRSGTRALGRGSAGAQAQMHTTYLDSNPNQSLADVLNDFITGVSFGTQYPDATSSTSSVQGASGSIPNPANRGLINIDFPLPFFLHSNPGDYAWGNAGFDAVITQLLNNLDSSNSGPPPMPKDQVDNLPTIKISNDQVKSNNVQCTVCMDDFQIGDSARQLPCEHFFHEDCIKPWLNLHASCPICRKTFAPGSGATTQNTSSGGSNETSTAAAALITPSTLSNPGIPTPTRNPNPSTTVSNVTNVAPNYDYTEDDCD